MRTIEQLLEIIQAGRASRSDLYGLSNLSQSQARQVWTVCARLPVASRRAVTRALVEITESDFEVNFCEILRLALEDEDAEVRRAAVEGLWEDEDVRLVPMLAARLLEDPVVEVRAAAATSLGRFLLLGELGKLRARPYNKVLQTLLAACKGEESVEVRRRALESLAYSATKAVVDLIRAAYQDPDERMQVSAIFAMGRSADERWAAEVARELHSANPQMRYEAAHACGELALEETVPVLIELVGDVDVEVQEAAIWALGQIGGDEARQTLEVCARSNDEALREAAREALRELEFLHGDLGTFLLFDFLEEEGEGEEETLW